MYAGFWTESFEMLLFSITNNWLVRKLLPKTYLNKHLAVLKYYIDNSFFHIISFKKTTLMLHLKLSIKLNNWRISMPFSFPATTFIEDTIFEWL